MQNKVIRPSLDNTRADNATGCIMCDYLHFLVPVCVQFCDRKSDNIIFYRTRKPNSKLHTVSTVISFHITSTKVRIHDKLFERS